MKIWIGILVALAMLGGVAIAQEEVKEGSGFGALEGKTAEPAKPVVSMQNPEAEPLETVMFDKKTIIYLQKINQAIGELGQRMQFLVRVWMETEGLNQNEWRINNNWTGLIKVPPQATIGSTR